MSEAPFSNSLFLSQRQPDELVGELFTPLRELRAPFKNQTKDYDCSYYYKCKGDKNLDGSGFVWS